MPRGRPKKLRDAREDMREYMIPLSQIREPDDPARLGISPDSIVELAHSIKQQGQLQAITLQRHEDDYEIIYGHRRFLAHQHLKRALIRACVVDWPRDKIIATRLIENDQRENMTAVEVALQFQKLIQDHSWTQKRIAQECGKSQAYVSDHVKVLSYPEQLLDALRKKLITFSIARELNRLTNPDFLNHYLWQAANNGATPAVVKRWVDEALMHEVHSEQPPAATEPQYDASEPRVDGCQCWFCVQTKSYAVMSSVWICTTCKKAIRSELDSIEEKQEDK